MLMNGSRWVRTLDSDLGGGQGAWQWEGLLCGLQEPSQTKLEAQGGGLGPRAAEASLLFVHIAG